MTGKKLLDSLGDIDDVYIKKYNSFEKVTTMNKKNKRIIPVAACLILVVAFIIMGNAMNLFGGRISDKTIGGYTLNFYKKGISAFDANYGNATSRSLTEADFEVLFNGIDNISGFGFFNNENNQLIHAETWVGDSAKIIIAAKGYVTTDTIIEAETKDSEIQGIKVYGGYFITDKNSNGIRNIIYFANFEIGETYYYVEHGGEKSNSDALRSEISAIIETLIKNGVIDLSEITA